MSQFGAQIREWRERRGISQRRLSSLIHKTQSYVSQLESGHFSAPNKEICVLLANALEQPIEDVWQLAAWDRLSDEQREFLEAKIATVSDPTLSPEEHELLAKVRQLQKQHPDTDVAQALIMLVRSGNRPVTVEENGEARNSSLITDFTDSLSALPLRFQHVALDMCVSMLDTWTKWPEKQ
jgi:transcriptional regulator with XRE-family HTH domain